MLAGLAESRARGQAEGRAEAQQQFLAQERAFLLRLAIRRFGEAVAQVLVPILEGMEDIEQLKAIEEELIFAVSGETLLARLRQTTSGK